MNIKNLLTGLLIISAFGVSAQKNKVTSAANYMRYYAKDQNIQDLTDAKNAIDEATSNATTADWWKTWYYRGQIYAAISRSKDPSMAEQQEMAIEEAVNSYSKSLSYQDKKMDRGQMEREYRTLVNPSFDKGVQYYQAKAFDKSIKFFQLAEKINNENGIQDSSLTYNIALAGVNGGMKEVAIPYLDKCIQNGWKGYFPFSDKAKLYLMEGNEEEAMKVLEAGRVKYPNEQNLLTQQLNIFLKNENFDGALANLDKAIENDPGNYIFYFARGTIFDNKGEKEKAETDYKKAIELKPDHFDSYYNLGAMYYNEGAEMLTEANNIPPNKVDEYEAAKNAAVEVLKKGLPYLEKAHEIDGSDKNTMMSLKTVYTLVGDAEKSIEMKKKIEGGN